MSKYIVTVTPPTPNGDLHIGHIAGPFLSADVFTRVQRQRGHECVLISYSDDYQSYMQRKGIETGIEPTVLAQSNTEKIKQSLAAMKISIDNWMSPYKNTFFKDAVSELFKFVQERGAIQFHESSEPYCESCKVWGYEAFGRGLCNYCGVDSDASQCEGCAHAPDANLMKDFHCKLCRKLPKFNPVKRAFLHLERFAPLLQNVHSKYEKRHPMDSWLDTAINQLKPWGITRPEEAGLDLEEDGSCRVHTWFMGMAGYIAAFREYAAQRNEADLFSRFWYSGDGEIVHFLGFDCLFSHAIAYPVLLEQCPEINVRQSFIPNQFLKLDGLNLSTSRNHAIWARELVEKVGSDSARLYLASIAPEEEEGDFRSDEFESWHQAIFEDLVPRIFHEVEAETMNWSWSRELTGPDAGLLNGLRQKWLSAGDASNFSMKALAATILDAFALCRVRLGQGEPVTHLAAFIAVAGQALIPDLSHRLIAQFRLYENAILCWLVDGSPADYSI
ncbi:methionine--tRNA ligase [Erwinia tasmaniensis]|uniref:methionine--tRNA ligase n=1 Tax=Erwinia tasmaniensis TaxID=338565 RepID=UPI003A4D6910